MLSIMDHLTGDMNEKIRIKRSYELETSEILKKKSYLMKFSKPIDKNIDIYDSDTMYHSLCRPERYYIMDEMEKRTNLENFEFLEYTLISSVGKQKCTTTQSVYTLEVFKTIGKKEVIIAINEELNPYKSDCCDACPFS